MSKMALSLTATLFLTCGANAQTRITNEEEPGLGGCGLLQRTEGRALQRPTGDIHLTVMTPGPDGGVMVGGSAFRDDGKGLILRVNGGDVEAILIPRLENVDGLVYTTKETSLRLYARTLYATNDGGRGTWRDIYFINSKEGWVVGDGIMRTADGGATWKVQLQSEEPTHPSLRAVYFADNRTGWAMSTEELLHTSDAGLTWKTIFKDPAYRDFGLTSAQKK